MTARGADWPGSDCPGVNVQGMIVLEPFSKGHLNNQQYVQTYFTTKTTTAKNAIFSFLIPFCKVSLIITTFRDRDILQNTMEQNILGFFHTIHEQLDSHFNMFEM